MKINVPGGSGIARHIKLLSLLSVAFLLLSAVFYPLPRGIVISDYKTGKTLYCRSAGEGDSFSISYIHSVNKSPVEDFFIIGKDGAIILDRSVFVSFGAGVPSASSDGGDMKVYGDRVEVTGINRRIDSFLLFVGVTAEHRFKMDDDVLYLRQISPPQRSLEIKVTGYSLFDFIKLR